MWIPDIDAEMSGEVQRIELSTKRRPGTNDAACPAMASSTKDFVCFN